MKKSEIYRVANKVYKFENKFNIAMQELSKLLTDEVELKGLSLDATWVDSDGLVITPVADYDAEFELKTDNIVIPLKDIMKAMPIKDINDLPMGI